MVEDKRSKFLTIFSNLPLNIRKEVIALVDGEPVSWNVAYLEIKGDTQKGKQIIKKLEELKII